MVAWRERWSEIRLGHFQQCIQWHRTFPIKNGRPEADVKSCHGGV